MAHPWTPGEIQCPIHHWQLLPITVWCFVIFVRLIWHLKGEVRRHSYKQLEKSPYDEYQGKIIMETSDYVPGFPAGSDSKLNMLLMQRFPGGYNHTQSSETCLVPLWDTATSTKWGAHTYVFENHSNESGCNNLKNLLNISNHYTNNT